MAMKFPLGTKFTMRRGKAIRECTIVDFYTTSNMALDVLKERYVVEYEFLGQKMRDCDVVETTIAMALATEKTK